MTEKKKATGIKSWPEDDRPREKLLRKGAGALSNSELLAILLRTGTHGISAIDLARKVSFGSQSKQGALTRSILMTVIHTAKKRLPANGTQEWLKKSLDAIAKDPAVDVYSLLPPPLL